MPAIQITQHGPRLWIRRKDQELLDIWGKPATPKWVDDMKKEKLSPTETDNHGRENF